MGPFARSNTWKSPCVGRLQTHGGDKRFVTIVLTRYLALLVTVESGTPRAGSPRSKVVASATRSPLRSTVNSMISPVPEAALRMTRFASSSTSRSRPERTSKTAPRSSGDRRYLDICGRFLGRCGQFSPLSSGRRPESYARLADRLRARTSHQMRKRCNVFLGLCVVRV